MLRSFWKTYNGLLEIRQITAGAGVDATGALNDWPAGHSAGHRVERVPGVGVDREEVWRLGLTQ